jgi:hypothetical protein
VLLLLPLPLLLLLLLCGLLLTHWPPQVEFGKVGFRTNRKLCKVVPEHQQGQPSIKVWCAGVHCLDLLLQRSCCCLCYAGLRVWQAGRTDDACALSP